MTAWWRRGRQPLRFLLLGALNTVVTLGLYLALKPFVGYRAAYFLSYVAGILLAYFANVLVVFKTKVALRTFLRFPLIYVIQYVVGALVVEAWVRVLLLPDTFAPLVAVALTLPLTYLLNWLVLTK